MRVGVLLVVLLSAALFTETEAWWRKVKSAATKVVDWAKDNCAVGITGVSCSLGRKRALDIGLRAEDQASLDALCQQLGDVTEATEGGVPFDIVKDVFEQVDGGTEGDDVLSETEFAQFMESMDACGSAARCPAVRSPFTETEAEAWWLRVRSAINHVVNWAKHNCAVGTSGVICTLSGVSCTLGRKRALDIGLRAEDQASLDALCQQLGDVTEATEGGVPFDIVKDVFELVDGGTKGDDVLSETEFAEFMESIEAFKHCVAQ